MKVLIPMLLALPALAACASGGKKPDQTETARAIVSTAMPPAVPAAGLPPQKLAPGQCGVFLWGLTTPRRFVFFSETTSGAALLLVGDDAKPVRLTAARGDVIGSFLTETEYQSEKERLTASLVIVPGEQIEDGQRIPSGRVVTRGADGWETILPVAGLYACMPG